MQNQRSSYLGEDRERHALQVQRVLAGDQAAFAEIYEAYGPRVQGYIMKRVGDYSEAEDLTQETFVQLYRSLESFEGRSSLLTWTFGIAHNVCSRHFRNCSRWMMGSRNARSLEDHAVDAWIEQSIDAARVLARCDKKLEKSRPPAHRQIFQLRYGERQSIRSIAENVGKSKDAVKVSLRRSRNALIKAIPDVGEILKDVHRVA